MKSITNAIPSFRLRAGKSFLRQDPSASKLHPMPIIVGCPRSGTTLLRFMLDSHPQMAIPPETGFFFTALEHVGEDNRLRKDFFGAIINFPSWSDFEIPERLFWRSLTKINPFDVAEAYRAFYRLYAERFGKPRWGDKTPLYCTKLDTIRSLLPEARFIHLIRDGRDAALSLRKMWFSPGPEIETLAAYWRDCVMAARLAAVNCADYLEVRYEDLILNTRETLKQICTFIDLDYDEAMLHHYTRTPVRLKEHKGRALPDGTLQTQDQRIRQQQRTTMPPDPACVFAWKSAMSVQERARFQIVSGKLLRDLGYEV
jgi:hypothetical protein